MIGQAQIKPQNTGATGFGGMDDHMNASSMMGYQHPSTPLSSSQAKLLQDLRKQVEFYFSPTNYPNDSYLQQLAASYGGSVPAVVILGFPKVREIFASAGLQHQGMNPQQAEIQLFATALETSEFVNVSHDGLWILAPAHPHHPQQIMHHHQQYGMTAPVPQQHNKGNMHSPYSVMSLHHSSMMFANNSSMPYGMPPHSMPMDHPQHLLPRSMPPYHNNHKAMNQINSHNHKQHHHKASETKNHAQQRRHSQGATKSEGGHNNNHHNQNNTGKAKKRNKKTRASFTGASVSVASTGSGGSGGGSGEKRLSDKGPLQSQQSSSSSLDSSSVSHNNKISHNNKGGHNTNTNNNNNTDKNTSNKADGNGNVNTNSNYSDKHNNNKPSNGKRRQSLNKKDNKKKQNGQQGGHHHRRSSSTNKMLSDEHFPSLPNQKGNKNYKKKEYQRIEKTEGSNDVEDTQQKKSGYAQVLKSVAAQSGPSSEDSTGTTVSLNTEMDKLAIEATDEKEDSNCW